MVSTRALLVGAAMSLSTAQALSTDCTARVASLALSDLGSCLALTSLLPVLSNSGSIISNINTYLTSLCASSTPTCSNSTLTSASTSIQSSCSSDISAGGTDATTVQVLITFINSYPQVYAAGCSKNSTTNGYCVTETLTNIQNSTGSDITTTGLTSLINGDTSALTNLNTGILCTGCVEEIYEQAVAANGSIATSTVGQAFSSQCGAAFASSTPSGVSAVVSASTTASAASSSSASTTGAGALNAIISTPVVIAGVSMFAAVAMGGSLLL